MHGRSKWLSSDVVLSRVARGGVVLRAAAVLVASAGSASAAVNSWTNSAGGNWNNINNWSLASVPADPTITAAISLSGTYTVSLDISPSIGGLLLTNPDAVIELPSNRSLWVVSDTEATVDFVNNASFVINSNTGINHTLLQIGDSDTVGLLGPEAGQSGEIILNISSANSDLNDATLSIQGPGLHAEGHTIRGKGRVSGMFTNEGVILADRDNDELRILADITQSAGGSIRAINNGVLGIADGGRISGGSMITASGGTIQITTGTGTIDGGVINQGDMGVRSNTTLSLGAGGVVNNGTITVNSNQGINWTTITVAENAVIDGTGEIVLNVSDANSDYNDARLLTDPGVVCTIGSGQSVTGKGRVAGDFVNNGTFNANRAGQDLRLSGTIVQGPSGTIKGTGGGIAGLDGVAVTGGFFDGDTGGVVLAVGGNNSVAGVTSLGASGLRNGASMSVLAGGFTNNGTVTVNSNQGINWTTITVAENAVIDGTGEIVLNVSDANSDYNDARLLADVGVTATHGSGHTISGKGRVSGDWINHGVIAADRADQDLQIFSATITQGATGVIRGDNAGVIAVHNSTITGGTLDSSAGGSVQFAGGANVVGGVSNLGDAGIRSGTDVDLLAAGFINDGLLVINSNQGINWTAVTATADTTIGGAGTIHLGVSSNNSDRNDAQLGAAEGFTLTVGPDQTITGRGRLFGDVVIEGTLSPGSSIDTIVMSERGTSGRLTLTSTSEYRVEASAEEVNDHISATVPVVLGGTLRFTPVEGFDPPRPTRYTIVSGPEITGEFDTLIYEGVLPEGGVFRVVYTDTETIAAVTCLADIAAPIGVLDLADVTWFSQLFLAGSPLVDLAEPFGVLDLSDILAFVDSFLVGCG